MIATTHSRLLRVLVIDDRPSEMFMKSDSGFSGHLTIKPVRSWAAAQLLIANEGDIGGADILLVDVSMEKDPDIAKASKVDIGAGVLPAGPLIALPFIGRRAVMSCVVYSAHLANTELQEHPFFLLAMGLITARTDGVGTKGLLSKHLSYGTGPMVLDQKIGELVRGAIADSASALKQGIVDFRDRLDTMIHTGAATVCNREALLTQMQALRKHVSKGGDAVLTDDMAIAIVGANWADKIAIRSLFADVLGWSSPYATSNWIDTVESWLLGLAESSFERAINVIGKQKDAEAASPEMFRPKATEVILKLYPRLDRKDLTEVLRLVVLFANAFALETPDADSGEVTKESVFQRLGSRMDVNIYLGLFGERKSKVKAGKARKSKSRFDKIEKLSAGKDERERCFLSANSTVTERDHEAIQKYRAAEEWAEWQAPYAVVKNTKRR